MLLKFLFGHTLRNLVLTVAAAAGLSYYVSSWSVPTQSQSPRSVPVALQRAVGDFCQNVYESFPASQRVLRPMLLIPLYQDRESLVTDNLRTVIDSNAQYRTIDKTSFDKILDTLKTQTGLGSNVSETAMSLTPSELASLMKSYKAETLLRGSLERLSLPQDNDNNASVEITAIIELWELPQLDAAVANKLVSQEFKYPLPTPVKMACDTDGTIEKGQSKISSPTFSQMYVIPAILCFVWSLLMIPSMRAAIREDSSEATMKTLLVITAIPTVAFAIYAAVVNGIGVIAIIQTASAAVILFFYHTFVMDLIARRR